MSPADCAGPLAALSPRYGALCTTSQLCDDPLVRAATTVSSSTSLQLAAGIACTDMDNMLQGSSKPDVQNTTGSIHVLSFAFADVGC